MSINYLFLVMNVLSIVLILGAPIALMVILFRKFKVSWIVVLGGFLAFAVAEAMFYFSIRYLSGILQTSSLFQGNSVWALVLFALIIGLLSALYVELMRLVGFMLLKKQSKSYTSALGFGAGSGALWAVAQSFFSGGTGLRVLIYFFIAVTFNPGAQLAKGVDTATVSNLIAQVQQMWNIPWHLGLIIGIESLIMLSVGIVLSTFVWKAVSYKQWLWLVVAILYHTLIVGIIYYLTMIGWNIWLIIAVMAAFLLVNLYLLYTFWKEESAIESDEEFSGEDDEEDDDDDEDDDEDDEEDISVDEDDTDDIVEVIDEVDPDEPDIKE